MIMGPGKTIFLTIALLLVVGVLTGCQGELGDVAYNGEQIGQAQWREFMSDQPAYLPPLRSDRMFIQNVQDQLN